MPALVWGLDTGNGAGAGEMCRGVEHEAIMHAVDWFPTLLSWADEKTERHRPVAAANTLLPRRGYEIDGVSQLESIRSRCNPSRSSSAPSSPVVDARSSLVIRYRAAWMNSTGGYTDGGGADAPSLMPNPTGSNAAMRTIRTINLSKRPNYAFRRGRYKLIVGDKPPGLDAVVTNVDSGGMHASGVSTLALQLLVPFTTLLRAHALTRSHALPHCCCLWPE